MGTWRVDGTSKKGILALELKGALVASEMEAFVKAHNDAIDALKDADYRVFCDIRELRPLSQDAADIFARGKAYSSAHKNFQGSAVLALEGVVSMQHRRTSVGGGVMDTELISASEEACWAHLATVRRS